MDAKPRLGKMRVYFYYGIASRYSYLAATQLERLETETETGCEVRRLLLCSARLTRRRGSDPFSGSPPSGQYDWGFRRRDAEVWAEYYVVPYLEPHGRVTYDGDRSRSPVSPPSR